jgi:glycosyltransferase involved in cell wall biosynthesis
MDPRLREMRESPSILRAIRLAVSLAADAATTPASPAWRDALDAAIDDAADDVTAIAAVHALARLPDAGAFDRVAQRLGDERPFIREHAVWALAASPVPTADERVVAGTLAAVRLGGLAGMLGQLTVERLARRPPGPDRWPASIRSALVGATLPGERVRLVETLGSICHPDATRHLRRIATDPAEFESVRVAAVAALGDRSDGPGGTTIRSLARTDGPIGDAARLAMIDRLMTSAARPARPADNGPLRIAQLYLHAALDPELTTVGMGETGGIATLLVRLGDALAARPAIGSITTISGGSADRALAGLDAPIGHAFAAVPIGETVPAGIGAAWPGLIDARRGIHRILRAHGPIDLLHLRMADVGSLAGAMAARSLGVETVFSLAPDPHALIAAAERDGTLSRAGFGAADARAHLWFRVALVQRLSQGARRIALFPRPDLRAQLRELVGIDIGEEPGRHVIVPEGIETTAIASASADPSPAWPDVDAILGQIPEDRRGRPLILSVGRMHDVKGMARVVEAWAGSAELVGRTNLVVVGGDLDAPSADEAAELQRIEAVVAASRDAARGLVLAGHQPSSTVARLLVATQRGHGAVARSGGAYVCGSRKEEFGLAIVEALAAGLPVVVPTSGGPASYIEEGWTGFAVETSDPQAIADGVMAALRVSGDADRARAARRMVHERFTIETMADAMATLYGGLVERPIRHAGTERSMATRAAVGA